MDNYKLVLPEHLNQFGHLFGGDMLKWVDEYAWIVASIEFPSCHFVTIAMDRVEFRRSVRQGTILRFDTQRVRTGTTSVQYRVNVYRGPETGDDVPVFSTTVTYVRVDDEGRKLPLPDHPGTTADE